MTRKFLNLFIFLFLAVFFPFVSTLSAGEIDDKYLLTRDEEIHVKQARAGDLNYKIEALHQQIVREQEQLKITNEKIWKEFSQNLEVERRELREKLDTITQRQTQFEAELERKRQLDEVRVHEKDNELKRMMMDVERLRLEIGEDQKVVEDMRRAVKDRKVRSEVINQEGKKAEAGSEVLQNGAIHIGSISGRQVLDKGSFSMKNVQPEYSLSVGDILGIEVWHNPDLTRRVSVRPDGRISLPLAGDLDVVGISLIQLREMIADKLKDYIRNPQVTIAIEGFGGRKFIMLGEISSPGVYRFQESITLIEAVALAGGFTKESHHGKIMIIRGDIRKQQQVKIITVNAANILQRGMLTENLTILPNDIIFLGKDFLGDYRAFMDDVINPSISNILNVFVLRDAINTAKLPMTDN
ncbi:MAG: hypothetical protein EXS63_03705 [Candidatus Omnitrophica bacterium]|nr:hypothetical protein [Candidatus Omnitrophota bacterium]